jgi:MoaA/NifB/PqqE/SkfB family radical SAM enzyme
MSYETQRIKDIKVVVEKEAGPTFCLAKWHHVTMYLQSGETHSCYHPRPHKIPLHELEDNPSALHNTWEKKMERKLMLEGGKPEGCQYCWNIEAMGPDYISDRHIRNGSIFTEERFEQTAKGSYEQNINPEYLEINFGNECNFKCGYCHPKYSTRFYQEIKEHGPVTSVKNHRCDIDWMKLYQREEENPYVDAFWKWWPELRKTLNIMRITGGEPTMHRSTYMVLDEIEKDPMPWLELNINSNLGTKTALVEKMSKAVRKLSDENKIRSFKLFSSIDTWGPRAEYTRTGLDLELWEKNLHTYLSITNSPVTFMITFNLFSVTSFTLLLEKILEWRNMYDWYDDPVNPQHRIRFDTPYLREPLQYDMNILPKEEFMPYMEKALKFMEENVDDKSSKKFSVIEFEKFKRVVDYMRDTVYTEDKLVEGRRDFYNWFNELDERRETDMLSIFPELLNFYRLCQETNRLNPL